MAMFVAIRKGVNGGLQPWCCLDSGSELILWCCLELRFGLMPPLVV